ncbi:MAG TPA: PAS domain-containing protein [Stellaceae bacterium]
MTSNPPDAGGEARDISGPQDPVLVRILEYWNAKRAGRSMPARADMDPPIELRGLATNIILYDVLGPGQFRVRLVGQAIVEFTGYDATGKPAAAAMPAKAAEITIEILDSVIARRAPRFRAGLAHWHRDKSYRKFEACFLPLSPDDSAVDIILAGVTFDTAG